MTNFSMCMQSFKSIDNSLAKLTKEVDTTASLINPPPPLLRGKGWKNTTWERGLRPHAAYALVSVNPYSPQPGEM